MSSILRQWVSFAVLTLCLPVLSFAETDVADYNKGGSVELVKGAFNPREPLQNLIEPNPARTRVVINSFPGFTFRVGFFKELQIDRITLLPFKDDRNSAAKDIMITTSSGKVIPATLTDTGWSHYWKGIAPVPQSIAIDDKCSWIKIEILNTYERGAAYGAIYKLQAFTSEDVSPYFAVTYNENKPKYLMRSIYEPENAATVSADAVTDGQPVLVTGFPRLVWNDEDVKYYQKMIAENKFAKKAWNDLLAGCESHMKKGYEIPSPESNDYTKTTLHEKNADQITALATAHILSGNKKPEYAKRAIEMLEKYSEVYASYGPTANPTLKHDSSKATWQRLNEAMWGIRLAIAYDFLMNDPSVFTSDKAQLIAEKLLRPIAMEIGKGNVFDAMTNWSSYDCTAVYMIGRLLDDQKFINWGKYGWAGIPGGKPGAGLISKIRDGIDAQGLWAEPSPGYVKMATAALVTGCEAAWNAGENWYALGGGNIQRMLEASSLLATPGSFIPALGDSGTLPIEEDYYTPHIEQVAYRSRNKANLQQMLAVRKTFTLQFRFQTILPSRDFNMYSASESDPMQSGFFPGLGYAIAREGSGPDGKYLLFDVNAAKSHGHPDKLQILYYNHGKLILNDQGSIFYDKPDYVNWYSKTPVHNTVSVNMQSMKKDAPVLEIFGSAGKLHAFAGAAPTAYPGCTLERTTLLLDGTVLDIFRVDTLAAGDISYNLHFADGKLTKAPPGEGPKGSPANFFSGTPFNMLTEQKKHTAGENAVFEWDYGNNRAVRYVVEAAKSEIISGKGIKPASNPDHFVAVRRKEFTHFFSAIDAFTGTPRVESVRTIPVKNKDLFAGAIQYTDGSKGWLLINYSNEPEKTITDGNISLQGRLAYSEQDKDGKLTRAIYIGDGGEAVMGKEINIAASGPCMVFVDRYADGFYTAQNVHNRGAGEVAIELPLSLPAGAKNYATDEKGKRTGAGDALRAPSANGRVTLQLKNFNSYELTGSPKGIAEINAEKRREKVAQEKAENKKRLTTKIAELSALYEKAAKLRPEGTVVVKPAEEMDSQSGGTATVSKEKDRQGLMARTGGTGLASIFQWNDSEHAISWKVTVPSTGYYTLALKYCSDGAPCRTFAIDGKPLPETVRELSFDQTGGFSRNEDQWAVAIVADPDFKIPYPLLLEKGEHVITLNAVRNSMNVDYLALLDYRLQPTREVIEGGKKNLMPEPDFKALRETYLSE
jgi:hypothetical protein